MTPAEIDTAIAALVPAHARHTIPRFFPCPRRACAAQPGAWCHSTGAYTTAFHKARKDTAAAATPAEVLAAVTAVVTAEADTRDRVAALIAGRRAAAYGLALNAHRATDGTGRKTR